MNRVIALALKDLTQLTRDRMTLFWALGFPIVFGVLFGAIYAGGSDGPKASKLAYVDLDCSKESKALRGRLAKSDAVHLIDSKYPEAKDHVRTGDYAAYVVIPKGWGEADSAFRGGTVPIRLGIDPGKKAEAGMLEGVVTKAVFEGMTARYSDPGAMRESANKAIATTRGSDMAPSEKASLERFMKEVVRFSDSDAAKQDGKGGGTANEMAKIESEDVIRQQGVHPATSYEITFPQGIVWGLISIVAQFAISLVRERQQGTMARLRSSPMRFGEILAGEGLACFMACAFVMALFMGLGAMLFHVRVPSIPSAALAIVSSSVAFVGIMVLLSTLSKTTQAASGSVWGVLMVCAMFGGGMIPLFMMPGWMQTASDFSPVKWSTLALEGAIWRGFTPLEMLKPVAVLLSIGVVGFALAVRNLRAARD